jgi:hypothetical protein
MVTAFWENAYENNKIIKGDPNTTKWFKINDGAAI